MKFEKEITVSVNTSKKELINFLDSNNYKKVDSYIVSDIYYVENDMDLDINSLEILKKCILIRSIDDKKHYLMYKYKEYDQNENIINQGKSKVQVINKEDANTFLKTIGYKELISIIDYVDVYEKDGFQICVQDVNNKYLFIEVEENKEYNTLEGMIKALEKTKIDCDKSNYFVKKAKIVFEEKYRNNKQNNIKV